MKNFAVVVAATASTWGIGKNGGIPWKIAEDLKFFKDITSTASSASKRNVVIMGRRTYESIPKKLRPLGNRLNIVVSRNRNLRQELGLTDDVLLATSLLDALARLNEENIESTIDQVYIIGGESIYRECVLLPNCRKIYLTSVEAPEFTELDTFFPVIAADRYRMTYRSLPITTESGIRFRFTEYDSLPEGSFLSAEPSNATFSLAPSRHYQEKFVPNTDEQQYLNLCREIITHGVQRGDRTGTGTLSKFGAQMRFDLRNGRFPLLTTKKVFWRGVAEELLWFIKGSTNANELSDKKIHIWDGNGSREFLDNLGFTSREVGDLGPVYGFQWRHFGAVYENMQSDYSGQGVDQLQECVKRIKNTPNDRRIVLTAWNPADLSKMALPPCHMFCQFYVANDELSCQMYQRSADMGLGVPFNIASYALLTAMMAQVCELKRGELIHTIGDAHVYLNHVSALEEQLRRDPRPFPKLIVNPAVKDIDGFQFSDFTVEGYDPDAAIKMTMSV